MTETGAPVEGDMPTPDMTRRPEQAERTLSPWERQKLEWLAQARRLRPDTDEAAKHRGGNGGPERIPTPIVLSAVTEL